MLQLQPLHPCSPSPQLGAREGIFPSGNAWKVNAFISPSAGFNTSSNTGIPCILPEQGHWAGTHPLCTQELPSSPSALMLPPSPREFILVKGFTWLRGFKYPISYTSAVFSIVLHCTSTGGAKPQEIPKGQAVKCQGWGGGCTKAPPEQPQDCRDKSRAGHCRQMRLAQQDTA